MLSSLVEMGARDPTHCSPRTPPREAQTEPSVADTSVDAAHEALAVFGTSAPSAAWTRALILSRFLRVAYVLAKLDLPEYLAAAPASCEELAAKTGADPAALARVLRVARLTGLVLGGADDEYTLTPTGALLREGVAESVRQRVIEAVEAPLIPHDGLLHSIKTGRAVFDAAHGVSFFDYMREREDVAQKFDASMARGAVNRGRALLAALAGGACGTIVDVGGGSGRLLSEVLAERDGLRGIVFDLPETIARARATPEHELARSERIEFSSGSFFDGVPAGAEYYVLSFILHDWNDADSLAILGSCRRAISDDGRLYVIEDILRPGPEDDFLAFLKLGLLELVGAGDRSESDLRALLATAGFDVVAFHRPEVGFAVLEARPTLKGFPR